MMRSAVVRTTGSNSLLTQSTLRTSKATTPICLSAQRQQYRRAHAISNPTLANIEKRWETMMPQEQADLWMQLRDRMRTDWKELTLQEKKAAYWIAFGPHGPRAGTPPGENRKVFTYTLIGVGVAFLMAWGFREFVAKGPPPTMNKEWQEKTNEYLKSLNVEPISGISSEGYKGKGQVQSRPKAKE
ncbi:MAG: Cytochrome c oxidase subunit 5A [Vezdaea acicularis]|nr:MAG: Cytochrome c oxidase subunit 5A [Vezdaea acicularis]